MKFIKKSEKANEMTFELQGEDHTFSGLLVSSLLEDKDVEEANYNIPHPLIGHPEFYLKVKKGKPREALKRTLKKLKKDLNGLI